MDLYVELCIISFFSKVNHLYLCISIVTSNSCILFTCLLKVQVSECPKQYMACEL